MIKKEILRSPLFIASIIAGLIVILVIIAVLFNRSEKSPLSGSGDGGGFVETETRKPAPEGLKVPDVGDEVRDKEVAIPTVATSAAPGVSAKLRTFAIKAEGGQFDPSKIIANKGDTINIRIEAIDGDYDFTMPDFGLKQVMKKSESKVVEFQATNEGQFTYYCESCGGLDSKARGTITIIP